MDGWIINRITNDIVTTVMLYIQIPTVNESSVTGDTDPTLFSSQVSQSESQVTADHTEDLQIKTNIQTECNRHWCTLCDTDQPSPPQLASIWHTT